MQNCFLLLGTNLGDKFANLSLARGQILQQVGNIAKVSSIYQTAAWGNTDQGDFLNQVLKVETELDPHGLLKICLSIEKKLGRKRYEKWGERLIDIDVLYFENQIIKEKDLGVPHPQLRKRRFTLVPLVELAPNFSHPVFRKTNKELLAECTDQLEVVKVNEPKPKA